MIAALIQVITRSGESRAFSRRDPKASSVQRLTRTHTAISQKVGGRVIGEKLD